MSIDSFSNMWFVRMCTRQNQISPFEHDSDREEPAFRLITSMLFLSPLNQQTLKIHPTNVKKKKKPRINTSQRNGVRGVEKRLSGRETRTENISTLILNAFDLRRRPDVHFFFILISNSTPVSFLTFQVVRSSSV